MRRVYPLPVLADLRKPYITSQFKTRNPSRPTHNGVDLFYRWRQSDGPKRIGDGGATRDPQTGQPRWFIPDGIAAISAADGVVQLVGPSKTGWRVWVCHADGMRTGYFHLRNALVVRGQEVSLGRALGEPGDNPVAHDAEHLHFEVSPQDRYAPTDPEAWLAGATYFTPP